MSDALDAAVRRTDPDRYLFSLFAPPPSRPALLALYAFDRELARASAVASQPTLALIRLQWWREVVEGEARRHEVATPLRAAIDAGQLAPADLLAMIDAREAEAGEPIPDLVAWRGYLAGAAGGVSVAAARLLGMANAEATRPLGAAYGAGMLLRAARALARRGRCLLPADVLAAHGLIPEAVTATPDHPALPSVLRALATEASAWLAGARSLPIPRAAIAAALPAVLARRDLRRFDPPGDLRRLDPPGEGRGFGDRAAVVLAGWRGRIR